MPDLVDRIMRSIPYSECGQPMYTIERLRAHESICGYCVNAKKRKKGK